MCLISGYFKNRKEKNILNNIRNKICNNINVSKVIKAYKTECKKYNNTNSKNILSNWPLYGLDKEIQSIENMSKYIDTEFDGIKAMITKNYDEILRTTFGDYMKLPPIEQQKGRHDLIAYWKEDKNEEN